MAKRRLKKSVKKTIAVVTTVFAGLSVFQIVPIEAEESKYTASVEDDTQKLTVDASAPSGVLPEDAKLVVTPIKNDGNDSLYEDTLNKLNEEAGKENQTVDAFIAYDIQFEKDDQEVEPENGKVNVDLKWETAVKPEGVQAGDKISVVHLKDDSTVEDLSKNEEEVEKDSSKDLNKATVETDENDTEAVQSASVTSDSFSVYTVVWTRENTPTINIHYVDENGNEISPVDTVNAPTDAGVDTLAKAIDGYTYAFATIDNGNTTELKSENGVLYFNDGTNWNQASSTDVYLTYQAVPENTEVPEETPEVTTAPSATPQTSEQPGVKTDENQLSAQTKDGKYSVTVSYGKDAGLPEGTTLSVKKVSSHNEKYNNAKHAVAISKNVSVDTLGMTALDITLKDKNGNQVEPKDDSEVKVNINIVDLPENVNSVDIHHITESDHGVLNSLITSAKKVFTGTTDQAEEVKKNVTVTDGQAVTDFEVSSFSVFTITWTKGSSTDSQTRIGNVTIHYVDGNGLEKDLADTTSITADDLQKTDGGFVNLSEYAEDLKSDDGTTYYFDHAVIGSRNGETITGLMIKNSTETKNVAERNSETGVIVDHHNVNVTVYKLYYTTDSSVNENSNWKEYKDSAGDADASNADVYLIYKDHVPKQMNIHFMTLDGTAIKDSAGNELVKTIDGAEISGNLDFLIWAQNNAPTGYHVKTLSNGTINGDNATDATWVVLGMTGDGTVTNGSITGKKFRFLKYSQENNDTDKFLYAGRGNASNPSYSDPGKITTVPADIYVTLQKDDTNVKSKTFTVKYKYIDQKDNEEDTNTNDVTFTLSNGDTEKYLDNTGEADSLVKSGVTKKSDNGSLIYLATRLGSSHGPTVTSVYVDNEGNAVYHFKNTGTMNYQRRNQWNLADSATGRNYTLYLDSNGNYSLNDSQHGTISLNKSRDAADTSDVPKQNNTELDTDDTNAIYTAIFHGERESTKYTVESNGNMYLLTVEDWMPSESTTIYETYIDGNDAQDKIWIEDDLKYSGYFKTGLSESLKKKLERSSTYTWHRVITTTDDNGNDTNNDVVVARKQTNEHWNIASAPRYRTWLDIEADEGDETWSKAKSVSYYVVVTYPETTTDESGKTVTINREVKSDTIPVQYYGQLENGSFEDTAAKASWSQSDYLTDGGVWRTTAPGSSNTLKTGVNGYDVEIVSGKWHDDLTPNADGSHNNSLTDMKNGYHWTRTASENATNSWAEDGDNFAELNAENAGALYQDVITHPNETLNYWFSHRARGSNEGDNHGYKYDTMYLVIMPTKLAMTGSSDGTELKTQTELQKFIENHGGFDSSIATSEQDEITYSDIENGILIRKVSSDQNGWHNISATNGYIAKGGLTRFFFVAASSCGDRGRYQDHPDRKDFSIPTTGNFIDNVGFSQSLPPTSGFNLTITETFSGITQEELAGLATNAASVSGITKQANPLSVRVSDVNAGGTNQSIDALNGAVLGFTVSRNGNGYVFTPTASINDTDLLTTSDAVSKPGTATVKTNADGSIAMTWAFPDQELKSGDDSLTDGRFRYSAADNVAQTDPPKYTTEVAGYTLTRSRTTDGGEEGSSNVYAIVTQHTNATINIVNTYAKNPHISVRKTFSGVTPSTVKEIMDNGYSITVKRQGTEDTKQLKASKNDSDVEVTSSTNTNGETTYVWTITDPNWQTGTYEISESGYETFRNTLEAITLNEGDNIAVEDPQKKKQWPAETKTVTINSDSSGTLSYTKAEVKSAANVSYENLGNNINLIVAQYGTGNDTRYVVWTENAIGLITRNAIIHKINSTDGNTGLNWTDKVHASSSNTSFFNGSNNGSTSITVDDRTLRFDGVNLTLSGTNEKNWNEYYATNYRVTNYRNLSDDSEIRIMNQYTPKLKIQKQSSRKSVTGDSNERLSGAKFRIYQKDSNGTKLFYKNGTWKSLPEENNPDTFQTGTDGTVELPELPVNTSDTTYYLQEYEAPAGYNKVSDIEFRLKENGTVVLMDNDQETQSINNNEVSLTFIDPYYTFIINDKPGFALPVTGGKGVYIFYVVGVAIIICAAALLMRRKKK